MAIQGYSIAAAACLAAALAGQGLAAEAEPDTGALKSAAAMEIAEEAARFLAGQPALAFDWFYTFDEVIDGREKTTYIQSGSSRIVRGTGLVSRMEHGDKVREYRYDGETFTVSAPYENFYASAPYTGSYDDLLAIARERSDNAMIVWSIMSPTLGDDPLADVEAAAYLGTTLIDGEEAHHLAFSEYDEDWQIWISTDPDRPVPLMYISTNPYTQGWPQRRADFRNWSFETEAEPGDFRYTPDEDDIRITMPALTAALAEPADAATQD